MPSPPAAMPNAAPAAAPRPRFSRLRGHPVLLAVDASIPALAATHVTAALADARGALPHAVRAFDTGPVGLRAPIGAMLAAADALVGPVLHAPDVRAVQSELARRLGAAVDWPVHVGVGSPASVIAHEAAEIGAALIVMGLRRHRRVDRVLRDETTLNVMRIAPCPVLGVTPALTVLPRCAVVGVDFGPASTRAARTALDLLGDTGTLVLTYVEPVRRDPDDATDDAGGTGGAGGDVVYALGVEADFERLDTDLVAPAGVVVKRVRVPGEPGRRVSEALFAVAREHRADLIAVGSRRHDWLDRALLGSVTTELARAGRCSMLVVPPPPPGRPHPLDVMARAADV